MWCAILFFLGPILSSGLSPVASKLERDGENASNSSHRVHLDERITSNVLQDNYSGQQLIDYGK